MSFCAYCLNPAFLINLITNIFPLSNTFGQESSIESLKVSISLPSTIRYLRKAHARGYRVYDKSVDKAKNDYFREMLDEVLAWGLNSTFVTGDAWYSGIPNLKKVKNHRNGFLFAIESN